ncbi:MAG: FAD-binding oxidoreductase [Phycisphaerae bacterium]|nr:FAD-binding oxidoreductase [Phycisphaerae bacterium]
MPKEPVKAPPKFPPVKKYVCRCTEILELAPDIKQFRLEFKKPETIDYVPGQYIQLLTPVYEKNSKEVYRTYSISSDPADKSAIELIIRRIPGGISTTYCFEYLKVGDEVEIKGPYGKLRLSNTNAPIVFMAGGSGMAPIKCMLHYMKNTGNKRKATYYFGGNKVEDLFYVDLMREFESVIADFRFVPTVAETGQGENWDGKVGLVTQVVKEDLKNAPECEAYLCGSPGMVDASIKVLKEMGIGEERIFYDKFEKSST